MALVLPAQREDGNRLIFSVPQGAAWIFGGAFTVLTLGIWWLFPDANISRTVFGALAVWTFLGLAKAHDIVLDTESGRWTLRWGWRFQTQATGDVAEIVGFFVERHKAEAGLVDSPLRSRVLILELVDGDAVRRFRIGFPMGPKIAVDRAEHYARRLGVEWGDRCPPEEEQRDG
ncbi:MAG: hypothetical protein AAGE94_07145 [Acidobacteriota bacterium]